MSINSRFLNRAKCYIALHIELLLFSLGGVCSKMASAEPFLSLSFILWYGLLILSLGIYAVVWQQIIKHLPLTTAYANKAVTIVWGIIWGMLFFKEVITWNMIVGAVVVIIGVVLVVMSDE